MSFTFSNIFGHKKRSQTPVPFDREKQEAVIKCSICNGEQVAGFRDKENGSFTEVMVIRSEKDLSDFKRLYGLDQIPKLY